MQWRNFACGCPWVRDGWVPHSKHLRKMQKLEVRNARKPYVVQSLGGVQGKAPDGGPGAKPVDALTFFDAETEF